MGAGKSTVGTLVAWRIGRPFVDLDARIERETGVSVAAWFASAGEVGFREVESRALDQALSASPSVIALGGGTLVDPELRARIRERSLLVVLEVSADEAWRRVGGDVRRPLLAEGKESFHALWASRQVAYADAHAHVDSQSASPEVVAVRVVSLWQEAIS